MARQDAHLRIIGIGASAGGLDALTRLLPTFKMGANATYVIAQHMARDSRIDLVLRLLQRQSSLIIVEAKGNEALAADRVYLIPPGVSGVISQGRIQLIPVSSEDISTPSINALLQSIAQEAREYGSGIILSGVGTDGLSGCRALKAYEGKVIAQSIESSQYEGMPSAVIEAKLADHILPPDQISIVLYGNAVTAKKNGAVTQPDINLSAKEAEPFNQLIRMLVSTTGNDFSQYKEETLHRKLNRQLVMLKMASLADYVLYLNKHPEDLHRLQDQFLISLSSFFRDIESFLH